MDNISELLNSISDEDMEKLKNAAASLIKGNNAEGAAEQPVQNNVSGNDMTSLIMKVAAQMNREDDKTALLKALRPLLSEERQFKADEAMKFLRLMDTLPLLKGLF